MSPEVYIPLGCFLLAHTGSLIWIISAMKKGQDQSSQNHSRLEERFDKFEASFKTPEGLPVYPTRPECNEFRVVLWSRWEGSLQHVDGKLKSLCKRVEKINDDQVAYYDHMTGNVSEIVKTLKRQRGQL